MSSQTPGRRSTRERRSPRNPSPMNTRGPRNSGLSTVENVPAYNVAGNAASFGQSLDGAMGRQENATAHSMNNGVTPVTGSTKPRITMRLNPPSAAKSSTPAGVTGRGRKSRMSEVSLQDTQPFNVQSYEDEAILKGSNRIEESGDDDYNPGGRVSKTKRAKKSLEPLNVRKPDPPIEPARAAKHQGVVSAAIEVARQKDNNVLAMTLKLLYQKSLSNPHLADLLEMILLQTSTWAQTEEFQTYVKETRKESRALVDRGVTDADFLLASVPPTPVIPVPVSPVKAPRAKPSKITSNSQTPKSKLSETRPAPSGRGRPSAAAAARSRGAGRAAASPPPASTRQTTAQRLETPDQNELMVTTRNGKKRPSATPEPSTRAGQRLTNNEEGRPRKRLRRSPAEVQDEDVVMGDGVVSDSDSALSDLHNSSPEPSAEIMAAENALSGNHSSTVHNFKSGGRQLKRQPEPGQKAKAKYGIGLPDDSMAKEKQRLAHEYNRSGPMPAYSELREAHEPSAQPYYGGSGIDGVFTPSAREQIQRQSMRSPATSSVDILIPPPPGHANRDSTPGDGRKRTGAATRFKNSPTKKQRATAGGIRSFAIASGRDSPVGVQADGESSNLDYCVTCGDSGELVCCDGCPRAFHLVCCDPPYDEEHPPAAESWYCAVCTSKREAIAKPPRSLFSALVHDVKRHNAAKFALPSELQSFFEGVHATEDGAYAFDETVQAKHRTTRAAGPAAEAEADPLKIKDTKGNFVLCFKCGLSAAGKREMIKCDFCGLHWHLDCLDPPPANPPVRQPLDVRSARPSWKCPAHAVDDKFRWSGNRTAHKIRRPKNAKIMDTYLNRGFKNNGNIEIENDPSEDEVDEDEGTIYRLTESSVKLDFIDRVRRLREQQFEEQRRRDEQARRARHAELEARFDFNMRSFIEQRAALSLVNLAKQPSVKTEEGKAGPDTEDVLNGDKIQELVHELVKEAPSNVVAMLSDDPPKRPSINGLHVRDRDGVSSPNGGAVESLDAVSTSSTGLRDRRVLLLIQDLINKKIEELGADGTNGDVEVTNGVK